MDELQIVTGNHDWKYIHVMLNIAEDDLDPYQYRLLGHYLRTVPLIDSGLKRSESLRDTAEACKMSVDKTKEARDQLVELGYITVRMPDGKEKSQGIGAYITILDRWIDNAQRSGELVRDLVQGTEKPVLNVVQAGQDSQESVRDVVQGSSDSRARADSLQESKDSKTPIESKESKDQEQKEKEKRLKDSREAWMKGLSMLLNIREDAYAQGQKYINFFQGKSPKEKGSKWDTYKIDNSVVEVNAVVLYAFAYWWTNKYKGMTMRKLETISEYFDLFTALKNYDDHIAHAEKDLKALLGLNEVVKREIVTDPEAYAELERLRELAAKMAHEGANPWQRLLQTQSNG